MDPEAEEREGGLEQHDRPDVDRGENDDERHHVRQQVPEEDARRGRADRLRRGDELTLAEGQGLPADEVRDLRPAEDRDDPDQRQRTRREEGGDDEQQEDLRDRVQDGDHEDDELVDPSAQVPCGEAETHADGELQRRRREADAQRDPAAVEESDGLASTDLVRAEDVVDRVERRRVVRVEEILLVELVAEHELLEDRRGERHEDEQDDDGEGGHGDPVAPQPVPRVRPEPRRGPTERHDLAALEGDLGGGGHDALIRGSTTE